MVHSRHSPEDSSLLALIIETAPDAIITADTNGNILSFSPAAERIFGHTEAEVIGRNVTMLMPEPYRSEHDGYMDHYLKTLRTSKTAPGHWRPRSIRCSAPAPRTETWSGTPSR